MDGRGGRHLQRPLPAGRAVRQPHRARHGADLTRSVARGRPRLLMEHSTGAVNWQPRNIAKEPGEMRRNSFAHIARGADFAPFFRWRASRFGAEKSHSTMLPHCGTSARMWRDVVRLGTDPSNQDELVGTRVVPDITIVCARAPPGMYPPA
nr:beta-galactosidase [Micromonospora sp. KC723]